jgi:hypothetical protein
MTHDTTTYTAGHARRRCPECGVEVEIARPQGKIHRGSTRSQRKRYSDAIRSQIPWQIINECRGCAEYWNGVVLRALNGTRRVTPPVPGPEEPISLAG